MRFFHSVALTVSLLPVPLHAQISPAAEELAELARQRSVAPELLVEILQNCEQDAAHREICAQYAMISESLKLNALVAESGIRDTQAQRHWSGRRYDLCYDRVREEGYAEAAIQTALFDCQTRAYANEFVRLSQRENCHGETLVSCPMPGGKQLRLCFQNNPIPQFTYSYGAADKPEITLFVPLSEGTVEQPWRGFGRTIVGGVNFRHANQIHLITISFDRQHGGDGRNVGGITIYENDEIVDTLECADSPESYAVDPLMIEETMSDASYSFDDASGRWTKGDTLD